MAVEHKCNACYRTEKVTSAELDAGLRGIVRPWQKLAAFWPQMAMASIAVFLLSVATVVHATPALVSLATVGVVSAILTLVTAISKAVAITEYHGLGWHQYIPARATACASCERLAKDNRELREAICTLKELAP